MSDTVEAFVPGHVTGFFTVDRDESDPTKTGSRGAGLTLSEGVTVRVSPATERAVELNGERVEMAAAERVLRVLDVEAVVHAETDLPVGAGFGVSGGVALGTALATNTVFDRKLSENELATIAHGAEVTADTGLGDVVAQLRGGAPVRLEAGGPQHAVLDGIPRQTRVEFVSFGELSTEAVIGADAGSADDAGTSEADDDTADEDAVDFVAGHPDNGVEPADTADDADGGSGEIQTPEAAGPQEFDRQEFISQKGREALSRVVKEPTLVSFVYASRRFAREAGLLTERTRSTIQDVSEAGGEASMAMLGETVFALGTGLTDAGYDPTVTTTSAAGATLL